MWEIYIYKFDCDVYIRNIIEPSVYNILNLNNMYHVRILNLNDSRKLLILCFKLYSLYQYGYTAIKALKVKVPYNE